MKSFQCLPPTCLALLLACSTAASAQTVYRCASSYSQTPCPGGVLVPADDPRSEAQRADALQAAAHDKERANALEATRLQDEAQALALAREEAAQRARLAQHKKREQHRAAQADTAEPRANQHAPHQRSAQVQQPGVFNAIASGMSPTKKAQASTPTP